MAMLAGVLAFAGCKNNKDNQDTTAASTGIDAVDAADTTEPSADSIAAGTARATTNAAAEAASSLPANITLSKLLQNTPHSSGMARKKMTKVSPSPMI